ncbi:hypothetical protein pb186bvf_006449 [Paramecium bursaria]
MLRQIFQKIKNKKLLAITIVFINQKKCLCLFAVIHQNLSIYNKCVSLNIYKYSSFLTLIDFYIASQLPEIKRQGWFKFVIRQQSDAKGSEWDG